MKVYVVEMNDYDAHVTVGVFADADTAKAAARVAFADPTMCGDHMRVVRVVERTVGAYNDRGVNLLTGHREYSDETHDYTVEWLGATETLQMQA